MHSMPGLAILRSRDLVNWEFVAYAMDKLDLGPAFRLEEAGTSTAGDLGAVVSLSQRHVLIFSNVNGQTTQLFTATNPAGPWKRTPMRRSLHDLSVLFDDDGKVYAIWGYQGIQMAELNQELTDIIPGTEREIIPRGRRDGRRRSLL